VASVLSSIVQVFTRMCLAHVSVIDIKLAVFWLPCLQYAYRDIIIIVSF
jgi:hypothetical protein